MLHKNKKNILWFEDISIKDIPLVGGKNASLGEIYTNLTKLGIDIPNGFAVTAYAYRNFLDESGIREKMSHALKDFNPKDVRELARVGKMVRDIILNANFDEALKVEIAKAYYGLSREAGAFKASVAVRSSATAEDLPDASFAGQQETFLNVVGESELMKAVKKCMASLFTDRAISYRAAHGYDHMEVALSVTVQLMVRSDKASSGVLFTLDTESGFDGVVLINSSYGLGEYVVKGRITPDQFYIFKDGLSRGKSAIISNNLGTKEVKLIFTDGGGTKQEKVPKAEQIKFSLSSADVLQLAKWGVIIEKYYGRPQDIEWAKDGVSGKLYIVQARPETVRSQSKKSIIETYVPKKKGQIIATGTSVGSKIGTGRVRHVSSPRDMKHFKKGEVLITKITDPDWEPIMRIASAIVTEEGGKTSHAAIVSREIGVPAIVGVHGAGKKIKDGAMITVDCSGGDEGVIFRGKIPFDIVRTKVNTKKKAKTKVMMNIGDPDSAFQFSAYPHQGVGLAREEFICTNFIRVHPLALINYKTLKDKSLKREIDKLTVGYIDKTRYFVDKLADGIARIAVAVYPHDAVIRFSDFKTNEYSTLLGGKEFEPKEENPMLGWRGASRYYSEEYRDAFALECEALRLAREEWGLDNIIPMIPFCRTPEEGRLVIAEMKKNKLERGVEGLEVYMMCELPSNVILAEEFAEIFDGFSIGSNDLTQLVLGVDRDSARVRHLYDERNPAVLEMIQQVIRVAKKHKRKIGICGQAPSDYPEFARFLVREKIDSISLNPDSIVKMRQIIIRAEKKT
jgi:pyruvate, water dikinase